MKMPCKVIEDLLPLYHDEVCSKESCDLVEEHIKECVNCKKILENMQEDTTDMNTNIDEAAPIKSIRDQWKKSNNKSLVKGFISAAMICVCLIGVYCGLKQWRCIPVSSELLEVTEISQLADGRIIYHLNINDNKDLHFIKFTTNQDGSYYMTPMRSVIEGKRTTEKGFFNEYFTVDVAEINANQESHGDEIEITSCYIGSKDDGILIWEKGLELPQASKDLEEIVK